MIKERIEKIIRDDGMTSSKFADEIGVQRSSISHILSGRNNPSLELVQKILSRYRNVNPEWLINGTGEAYKTGLRQTNIFEKNVEDEPDTLYGYNRNESEDGNSGDVEVVENLKENKEVEEQANKKRDIHKIVVFYSDNTFEEFIPQ